MFRRFLFLGLLPAILQTGLSQESGDSSPAGVPALEPFEVTGRAPADVPWQDQPELRILSGPGMPASGLLPPDEILRNVPGVRLFRRSGSSSAHPTTQGITVRNIGPNGAGRALVLLDGVPQNDPFGGWIVWSSMRGLDLRQIAVIPASSGGLFGNQSLAGTIRLTTRSPSETESSTRELEASIGSFNQGAGRLSANLNRESFQFQLNAAVFDSDGFHPVPEFRRGPIDRPLGFRVKRIRSSLAVSPTAILQAHVGVSLFEENRVNGSPQATNSTEGIDSFFRLSPEEGSRLGDWELLLYWQDRDFRNQFTSLSEDRTAERPVLNQFAVPGEGWGGSYFYTRGHDQGAGGSWTTGVDFRVVEGDTNEAYRNLGSGFTRSRTAGGKNEVGGLFIEGMQKITSELRLEGGLRIDHWAVNDGSRRERNLETGTLLASNAFPERTDEAWTGRLTLRFFPETTIEAYLGLHQSFRLPTLNEFYRPFRVGNDITEANPQLDPETLRGFDVGLSWEIEPWQGSLKANGFVYELKDGITNVTLVEAMGGGMNTDLCGFVPGGGSCRQRLNVDRIEGYGFDFQWLQELDEALSWTLRYQFSHAEFTGFPERLSGNRPAQSPRHSLGTSLRWQFYPRGSLYSEFEYVGSSFEDDLNTRTLESYLRLSLQAEWQWNQDLSFYARVDNLTDEAIPTRVEGSGDVLLDAPRSWQVGARYQW